MIVSNSIVRFNGYHRFMTIFINDKTALLFWCMVIHSLDENTLPSTLHEVKDAEASLRNLPLSFFDDIGGGRNIYGERRVLHVLVDEPAKRTKTKHIVTHLRKEPYPVDAFRRYAPNVLIASPELCFFEMASVLPFLKLVEFGYFLCGTYTLNPSAVKTNARQPLTNKTRLATFIERMGSTRGCRQARKALNQILENSASPRETKTAILLCLPVKMGGFGFVAPTMNHRIDFSESEQLLFGRTHVVLDLYWHDYDLGIEYDGENDHTDDCDVSRDRKKSSELNYRGITVLRVDKEQLSCPYQVYVLAKKLAHFMGKSIRKPTQLQLSHRKSLFDSLMR